MTNFEKWHKLFNDQNLYRFNHDADGLLWLKVRAVSRKKQIEEFLAESGIKLQSPRLAEKNVELFEILEETPNAMSMLDKYLGGKSHEWYAAMNINEKRLKNDLYSIESYEWGGNYSNSLDKHLVSQYVKTISNYDELLSKQPEIADNAWKYVQTSWYNNWTSYLIEALFKRHKNVISAVGEIKSVDFFIKDCPIDLKVTFFPNQFMEMKMKEKLGKKELTWLKQKARSAGISLDKSIPDDKQLYILTEKLSEIGKTEFLYTLRTKRKEVIDEAQANKEELIGWLYTNQGEMRFGAENRLFLILVDTMDMRQSWKMKRAFSLLEPKVNDYLNNFNDNSLKEISFTFKGNRYKSLSDIIFVVK